MITLTTDFGIEDAYVGSMKGVILSINPRVRLIDIAHQLPAHHIQRAAYLLREVCPRFPQGTIHVAVVDPGVGGQRSPLLLKIEERYYVGPDNGIFGLLLEDFTLQGAWKLENREFFLPSVSQTFHGRDIFAPVAAHLAAGIPPASFGPTLSDPKGCPFPPHHEETEELRGQVVWVDRFGNCITNLTDKIVSRWAQGASYVIEAASERIEHLSTSYESIPRGRVLALFNSMGFLEIACNQARADKKLDLVEGDPVILEKAHNHDPREGNP
jgi:S-adenosylmethionine hydrolase